MRYCNFDNITVNEDWSFLGTRKANWTHGYHRYPAKFSPEMVSKLIEIYGHQGDLVADLFAGCGTTLVEAKMHGLSSVGIDVNPVATLITRVKTTPLEPRNLLEKFNEIITSLNGDFSDEHLEGEVHPRLTYWHRKEEILKIKFLFKVINAIKERNEREFFLVAVSHVLKNCSWWLQGSTKPQKDPHKKISSPYEAFKKHCRYMLACNKKFYEALSRNGEIGTECRIYEDDARRCACIADNSVSLVVTSPPYVTSYEYADIHQLTAYWMNYVQNIEDFRRRFIGTSYSNCREINSGLTGLSQKTVDQLRKKDVKLSKDVEKYFVDMQMVASQVLRILKPGGLACFVIGNTSLKGIPIKSAEVFYGFLMDAGLIRVDVIKRSVSSKVLPTLRDRVTGKFTNLTNSDCVEVYPNEYIVVVRKKKWQKNS